jgi:preprotein translocase subunit SecA
MNHFNFNIAKKEKDVEELFKEIDKINKSNQSFNLREIKDIFFKIKNEYNSKYKNIFFINENETEFFLNKVHEISPKKFNKYDFYISLIPILIKGCSLKFGYEPRVIQIIALLFFLFKDKHKGLIEQIYTGEGKTIIISFLAIIKALEGKKVDILTSSCVLAERDATEMKDFYNLFGLSVDYCKVNNDKELFDNSLENLECYNADIVYGDSLSLEADILRTNFMGIVGRGYKRPFDCIIIDEVDNICLDNIKNITELLDNFHGYKYLEYIYLYIYNQLFEIDKKIKQDLLNEKFKKNDKIEDYQLYIIQNRNNIIEKLINLSKEELLDFQKLAEKNIFIPHHLHSFIKMRIKKWCESAYDAMYIYKKNKEYIISNDPEYGFKTIKPVDFSNTGVIQENSVWTGLHQFLEIKEGLRLTEENINSCYMSNLSFFKKYISNEENNIYGLTGTLGTNKSKTALQILYNLTLFFIPSFKERKFKDIPPKISNDINEYNNMLINEIIEISINQKRAILIIFKYIEEVNILYDVLLEIGFQKSKIFKYTRNDIENQKSFLNNEIQSGTIILSTNLSGRGTDIRISKLLEKNSGLHVVLTFVPTSQRIEAQAFGRAGRKGENGSGQYILYSEKSFDALIKERDIREENDFTFLIDVYQKKVDLFAEIFENFSLFLKKIEKKVRNNEAILLDIKEKWALFLLENELTDIEKEYKNEKSLEIDEQLFALIKPKYEKFKESITNDIEGEYKFLNALILSKTKIIQNCDEAVIREPVLSLGAYMFRAFENVNNRTQNYKNKVLYDFQILENNLLLLKNQFIIYQKMMNKLNIKDNSDLFQQNQEKIDFIEELYSIINHNTFIIESYIDKNEYNLSAKRIYMSELNFENRYSKDIIEYFKDYGGICLFQLQAYKRNFFSRIFSF